MEVKDITSLGISIEDIAMNVDILLKKYGQVRIDGIGVVTPENEEIVVNTMKIIHGVSKKIKGNKKNQKKLTIDDEFEVITCATNGYRRVDMAKKFGVSEATISRILRRHNIKLTNGRPKKKN